MDRVIETLRTVLEGYTGKALNGYSYLTESRNSTVFAVVSIGYLPDKHIVDALLQARGARRQIVLAYAGEPVEASAT